MRFVKMQGNGNDYVYINGFEHEVPDPPALTQRIADRHFGVGGDGLILVLPPEHGDAHVRMRMFNADGSEAEMCGNGIRCVCKFAHDHGLSRANPMTIQTQSGLLTLSYRFDQQGAVRQVTVDMGEPRMQLQDVAADPAHLRTTEHPHPFEAGIPVDMNGDGAPEQVFAATLVSMGNPHAVIFVEDLDAIDLHRLGPKIEHHPAFANRINVHFVKVHDREEVTVRHWERGSGPTLACGTGACAVCVAGVLTGHTERKLTTHLPGGPLELEWNPSDNHIAMTGPAVEVFSGEWPD